MKIRLLAFGIAKEIFHSSLLEWEIPDENATVDGLRTHLEASFPEIRKLASYMVAVNNQYATGLDSLQATDEIAIIPPVSGG